MAEDTLHELTGAYALDALDEDAASEYEAHLRDCARCREELAELQGAAASLAYAIGAPSPPAALRDRILEQARAERPNVVPMRPRRRWLPVAAAAAAAALALGLGIRAVSLSSSLSDERSANAEQSRALALLAQPGTERVALQGADGVLVLGSNGHAALVVSDMDAAPAGKTYEAWVMVGDQATPAGLFDAGDPDTVVGLTRPVPEGGFVGVTVEDEGGASKPTSDPIVTARPA
jgi:anti-sigma factor RsiW